MRLAIHVAGALAGWLESQGDFACVMSYAPDANPERPISLTMPVRLASYTWRDALPPVLQQHLPEGYLLQALQEDVGPHLGAQPMALLSLVGRNMIGWLQVAPEGASLDRPPAAVDVAALLRGDNSEAAFAALVREHARCAVSGAVPKFLNGPQPALTRQASVMTPSHIVKGAGSANPFIALNEYFCMQVAKRITPTAHCAVSEDGLALAVEWFDTDTQGRPDKGFEDFCSLLGLRPSAKYDTTWERITQAVRTHIFPHERHNALTHLGKALLLNMALRNADAHAKNFAVLARNRSEVAIAPLYDIVTTAAYPRLANNPPAIGFAGKRSWSPGKLLERFLLSHFLIEPEEQRRIVEAISDAMRDSTPMLQSAVREVRSFAPVGEAMLAAWQEGLRELRSDKHYGLASSAISSPTPTPQAPKRAACSKSQRSIGRSGLRVPR